MHFTLILCQSRERTYGRKRQKDRERLETTQRTRTQNDSDFLFSKICQHILSNLQHVQNKHFSVYGRIVGLQFPLPQTRQYDDERYLL